MPHEAPRTVAVLGVSRLWRFSTVLTSRAICAAGARDAIVVVSPQY